MTLKKANDKLFSLLKPQRDALGTFTGLKFEEKNDRSYYKGNSKARPLNAYAFRTPLSAQTIASYWLATSSYPKDISHKVNHKKGGKSNSTYTTKRGSSPSGSSTDGKVQSDPPRRNRNNDSTSSSGQENLKTFLVEDRRYVKMNDALYPVMEDGITDDNQQPPPNEYQDDQVPSKIYSNNSGFAGDRRGTTPPHRYTDQRRTQGRGGGRSGSRRP